MSHDSIDRGLSRILFPFPASRDRCLFCGETLGLSKPRARDRTDPGWYDEICFQFAPVLRAAGVVLPAALLRLPVSIPWEGALGMELDS